MPDSVDLYNTSYGNPAADAYCEIRRETYGEDFGLTSWVTLEEFRGISRLLEITASSSVLEIGSGAGGCALHLAEIVGCRVIGLDANASGVRNANAWARARALDSLARFERHDASVRFPFEDEAFDALFSNDAMCHIPGREAVLREFHRVLKSGGRMLFSDALVLSGTVSNAELATRSSIGYYSFCPCGENEKLIREAGFELLEATDTTAGAAAIAKRWHDARAKRSAALIVIEGERNYEGLQKFLLCVHTLTSEKRLSRFLYLARKPD